MFKKENEIARLKKEFNRLNTLAAQKITEELIGIISKRFFWPGH